MQFENVLEKLDEKDEDSISESSESVSSESQSESEKYPRIL